MFGNVNTCKSVIVTCFLRRRKLKLKQPIGRKLYYGQHGQSFKVDDFLRINGHSIKNGFFIEAQCLKIFQKSLAFCQATVITIVENKAKSRIFHQFLSYKKVTCLVTLFDCKLQDFKNSPNQTIFGIFNQVLFTQNVTVARFARNVE